jgi:hypothetical protein
MMPRDNVKMQLADNIANGCNIDFICFCLGL